MNCVWPQDFPFDSADKRGSRQYDDTVLAQVRPKFEQAISTLVQQTVNHAYAAARKPDAEKALAAAAKNNKAVANQLTKKVRDEGLLDREFDQFGQNALKTVLKEISAKVEEWAAAIPIPEKKPKTAPAEPNVAQAVEKLSPLLSEFAKLDGYNVWRRSGESQQRTGKLTQSDEGDLQREPTLLSWIVPVRQWAELESWGEDPETKGFIARPTHPKGDLDPEYLSWLRDTLKVFDDDATVKKEFLDRLDPDCLEALDFNLAAGRHKPFVFDAGQHRPPAELIGELQVIHGEVQKRLGRLLSMVGGGMIGTLPKSWAAPKLSDICQINPRGKSGLSEDDAVSFVPMAAVSEFSGSIVAAETRPLREVQKGFTPFQEGDVLFAKITPCMENGKTAIARNLENQRGYGSTEFHIIRPSALVLAEWIFAIIRTAEFRRAAASSFQGAVGQQRVTASFLESFRIPLPPLSEQQLIVEILQEAEDIRRLHAQAEAKINELIPAIFAATFGDLYFGKSPFPVQPLCSIGDLDRGRSRHRPRDEQSLYGGPYPFLQTGDVAQANGWITSYTQTYSEKGLEQSRLWPKGTLAITIAANIGSTAILTFEACFPDSVVGFTPNSGISAEYVRWWLLGYQKKLEIQAPQGAQKNINLEVLRSIQIPVPPPELQLKFQAEIQNIREQMEFTAVGAKTFESLKSSISAHAFSGQLTADWREAHKDNLILEARGRDTALKEVGTIRFPSRLTMAEEIEELLQDRTDGIYSELNGEQYYLLREINRMVGGVSYVRYFSAKKLSDYISEGPLRRNPQAIEGHLAVFAVRGLIIPVSREEQTKDTAEIVFGNAYRLPLEDFAPRESEEDEPRIGDHTRLRELERLAAQLEKERGQA